MYGDQSGECELVKIKGVMSWRVGLNRVENITKYSQSSFLLRKILNDSVKGKTKHDRFFLFISRA